MAQLAYQIPDAGRKKRILRIPESHTLYLCPNACGRRQGIRALRNGEADHASFLRFDQADVVSGDYVGQVSRAVGTLLGALRPQPRVIQLYVNCIDDFIGTDGQALVAELRSAYPQTRFTLSHINPVSRDVAQSPAAGIQAQLYRVLEAPAAKDRGVTVVGHFEPPRAESELWDVLRMLGLGPVRQLFACETFDEYQAMAKSCMCLGISWLGEGPAAVFAERFGTPTFRWPATYDIDEVGKRYAMLREAIAGMPLPKVEEGSGVLRGVESEGAAAPRCADGAERRACALGLDDLLAAARERAQAATSRARAVVGNLPVFVDSSASLMPFSLALALMRQGFNVRGVFGLHLKGNDSAAEAEIAARFPDVAVVKHESAEAINGYGFPRECLAIGQDAAFLLHARHVVDLYHDEGFFGYDGIALLMDAIAEAVSPAGAANQGTRGA